MLSLIVNIVLRDLNFYFRKKGEWSFPLLFCILISLLFSLTFPYHPSRLTEIAPTILWVNVILATMLSLENIFQADLKDGALEQLLLTPAPLSILILGKALAHWLAIGLPLTFIAPVLGFPLQLSVSACFALMLSLLLGMPILSLVGMIAVALTLGLARGGIFLTLLILPLILPVLILGSSLVYAAIQGLPFSGQMALLSAILIFTVCFAPLAIAAALRLGVQ